MFWRLELASLWRLTSVTKNACLTKIGAVFKSFSVFPSNFCDYSSSLSTVSFPNTPCTHFQTPLLLHFFSKSSRKGMGLVFPHFIFPISWMFCLPFGLILCSNHSFLCVMGMECLVWYCSHLFSCWAVTMCFSLFWYLPVVESENLFLNGFGVYLTCSFHVLEYWCWISVLVTEFLW